ncbi:MAG TPA: TetR/AcrR family transcriptional regulator [Edaphobacter sp.]
MKKSVKENQIFQEKVAEPLSGKGESVLLAAIDLFARYGYRKTSIDDIAAAANVAKRTVYLHFESKADVFRAMALYLLELTRSRVETALKSEGSPADRLTALLYANYGTAFERFGASDHVQDLEAAGTELLQAGILAWEQEYEDYIVAFLRGLKRKGEIGGPPPGLTLAQIVRMTMRGATAAKHEAAIKGDLEAYRKRLRELALFLLAALR